MRKYLSFNGLFFSLALCLLASCRNIMPGGFWTSFHKEFVIQSVSDQGPRGGDRKILWESNKPMTFSTAELIRFAQSHDWKFVDSSSHQSSELKTWIDSNSLANRVSHQNTYFDKWTTANWKLLRFDSKWTKESRAGSGEFVTSFGNILVNDDGSKMMLIHIWGE